MVTNFDNRWDTFTGEYDNAHYRVPQDTAPLVINFLSDRVASIAWVRMNKKRIAEVHRLIGASGSNTDKKNELINAIDTVIQSAREAAQVNGDQVESIEQSSSQASEAEAAREFLQDIRPSPVVGPARVPSSILRSSAAPSAPAPATMSAATAHDLPLVGSSAARTPVHVRPSITTTTTTTRRTAGELDSDPIELDASSSDEEVHVERTVVQDLGSVALGSLRNLNMTAVDWITMTEKERPWKTARNQHEAVQFARVFDQIGIRDNDHVRALILKRIIALQHFDSTGNVNVLDVVQGSAVELLPTRLVNAIYTQLQRRTQSQSRGRSSSYSSSSNDGPTRRHNNNNKRGRDSNASHNSSSTSSKKPRGPPSSGGAAPSQ